MGLGENARIERAAGANVVADDFHAHSQTLLRFVNARIGSRAAAEDIVQEAFLRLSQVTEEVRHPRAFLFQAAINLVRNLARSERRRAALADYADLLNGGVDPITPERQLLAADELARVAAAIRHLPPVCGQVFRMHRFEELTQREIAARLGISTTAVEKSMRRALRQLAAAADGAVAEREVREKSRTVS